MKGLADALAPAIYLGVLLGILMHWPAPEDRGAEETCARVAAAETRVASPATAPPATDFPDPCSLETVTCEVAGLEDVGGE